MLFTLHDSEAGYTPRYVSGLDYSLDAVSHSSVWFLRLGTAKRLVSMSVIFSRSCPLLHPDTPDPLGGWDLLLGRDKGTYDAIAL